MLSAFGEHVTGELVEACVLAAAREAGLAVAEFSVGAEFLVDRGAWGRHVHLVEFTGGLPSPPQVEKFRDALDRARLPQRGLRGAPRRAGRPGRRWSRSCRPVGSRRG